MRCNREVTWSEVSSIDVLNWTNRSDYDFGYHTKKQSEGYMRKMLSEKYGPTIVSVDIYMLPCINQLL